MGDTIQIVDTISASPTVLLDLNNETPFACSKFDARPPPLRRSVSSSMLTDGDRISASSYSNRTISMTVDLFSSTQDAHATSWQTLARLLDSDAFWLKYQPTGATAPVFFRCYRADVADIDVLLGSAANRSYSLSIPAYPAAYGLRHDVLATQTVNNDPAAGSNGLFLDVTGVDGDLVTEPLVWAPVWGTVVASSTPVFATEVAPTAGVYVAQAEAATMGTDTTVQANDPLMSGAGSNYVRTTFATPTMAARVTWAAFPTGMPPGDYRIFARMRWSAGGSVFNFKPSSGQSGGGYVRDGETTGDAVLSTTGRTIDLGILPFPAGVAAPPKLGLDVAASPYLPAVTLNIERVSGTATLDTDYILAVPANSSYAEVTFGVATASASFVLDSVNDTVYQLNTAGPYTGTPKLLTPTEFGVQTAIAGSLPILYPNVTTRIHMVLPQSTKASTASVSVSYWPKYLYVRPATT